MPRPRLKRKIKFNPETTYFKPQGVPMRNLKIVNLTLEEMEAYRLRHLSKLDQNDSSKKMNTSSRLIKEYFI